MNYRIFLIFFLFNAIFSFAQDLKAPRETTADVVCPSCPQGERESLVSDCVCNELTVTGDATIQDDLVVTGKIKAKNGITTSKIEASSFKTLCGSSLNCDLFVENNATIGDELTVGCDVIVGCNILMHNSTDALHGNIIKDSNRFMHNSGVNNTFLGENSGTFTTTGNDNVGVGSQALTTLTSGTQNTAVGSQALATAGLLTGNTALGYATLQNSTSNVTCCTPSTISPMHPVCPKCLYQANYNTAVGDQALQNNVVGSNNVAVGSSALASSTTKFNTNFCLEFPPRNTGAGAGSGGTSSSLCTFSGQNNTAVGTNSLMNVTIGSNNIAMGYESGINSVQGFSNIYIGNQGCITAPQASLDTFFTVSPGTDVNENNTIRIGDNNVHTDVFISGVYGKPTFDTTVVPIYINANGELCTNLVSSERFKEHVKSLDQKTILEKLANLNVVSFFYKSQSQQENKKEQVGLIAEQVAEIFPELVVFDEDGKPFAVRYELLAVLCIAALQSMEKQQQDTTRTIASLQKQVQELQTRIL